MAATIGISIAIALSVALLPLGLAFLTDFRELGSRHERWHHYVSVVPWNTPAPLDPDEIETRRLRQGWVLIGIGIVLLLGALSYFA